jgi:aminomethyltransferase
MTWDFLGGDILRAQFDAGPTRLRVGIRPDGRAPARAHTDILDAAGTKIGMITSGGFGPSVDAPIAMGYVDRAHAADGTAISLLVRGKPLPARIVPLPFVPHRYAR